MPSLLTPAQSSSQQNAQTIVTLSRIGLRYGRNPETLRDIDLNLTRGAFTFLTGPSGAGKTSLLKIIYLALKPSRGFIHLFGEDVSLLNRPAIQKLKQRIGIVLQEFQLIDHLSVFENAALPLRISGQSHREYRQDVGELLQWVGLGKRFNALPTTLSGGEKQRLAIARAVIARPEILIADEPTGNVDPDISERILRLFKEMNRLGTTVLIATHDRELIERHEADNLYIENGHIIADKPYDY